MRVKICEIEIELKSDIPAIRQEWQEIFANHQATSAAIKTNPQIIITALPIDKAQNTSKFHNIQTYKTQYGTYSFSQNQQQIRLVTASGAILIFESNSQNIPSHAQMFLTKQIIDNGQIEDITFTLLAPLLRNSSIYIVHAFGAVHPVTNEALLLIGPSGSGKTTSGLSLIEDGWSFLGNDAIFLSSVKECIVAWPSPGRINIHPNSIQLLNLPSLLNSSAVISPSADGKIHLASNSLFTYKGKPSQVKFLIFPQIFSKNQSSLDELPQSIGLTKLMEQSIDNWDTNALHNHLSFLHNLILQTSSYEASLSKELDQFKNKVNKLF